MQQIIWHKGSRSGRSPSNGDFESTCRRAIEMGRAKNADRVEVFGETRNLMFCYRLR